LESDPARIERDQAAVGDGSAVGHRLGLQDSALARAQCGTIRTRLLKLGAQVRVSVRRVWVSFSESFPAQALFIQALRRIQGATALPSAP